jgi:polygalacturonase
LKITNYDDAVAVKPSKRTRTIATCSENILVEDCYVVNGVGMTIGSVPANPDHNCVRNVTFRNIYFDYPIKGVYVKTNPGHGSGEITNVVYENIIMNMPMWWAIYIGPQ